MRFKKGWSLVLWTPRGFPGDEPAVRASPVAGGRGRGGKWGGSVLFKKRPDPWCDERVASACIIRIGWLCALGPACLSVRFVQHSAP